MLARERVCQLCGLALGSSQSQLMIGGELLPFCCPGCQQVFLLLFNSPAGLPANFRETDLYRACVEAGIIPRAAEGIPLESAERPQESSLSPLDLTLKVEGMWCPTCSWLIEEVLRRTKGILEPQVSFLSDLVQVKYFPHLLSPPEIMTRISRLGFRPALFEEDPGESREKRSMVLRLGVSAILTTNIMMISMALYFGFFRDLSREVIGYFSYPLWLMATPVVFYGGLPILRRGLAGLRYGNPSMDSLISIGALAAYLYSLVQLAKGSIHLYFDTPAMLITFVLLGKYIETHARERVAAGITDLYKLAHQKVRLFTATPTLPDRRGGGLEGGGWREGEKEHWVPSEDVKPGDDFLVLAGERVPLDGQILSGQGDVDESILTGEARPVKKQPGDGVMGGALLLAGELQLKTTRIGRESSLGQMITLMQEALAKKNPAELLADRITRWFVPAILALAGLTAFYLWLSRFSVDEALLRSLTVLLISCPCALGIATPLVKVAIMGLAKSRGILIRDPGALDRTKDLDTLVFDKTGTLTEGNFSLQKIFSIGTPEREVLSRVAAVEIHSNHFLAREIVRRVREENIKLEEVHGYESLEGMGVKGNVKGDLIFIGNRQLMAGEKIEIPSALNQQALGFEEKGMTTAFFGWGKSVQGFLVFGDSLKKGIREMVRELQARGITTWIVSGDGQGTTRAVAGESGVVNFLGQALPQDKVKLIKSLQDKGHRVGMVGDGINDAAALAQADVGFALGTGTHILQKASDFTLLASDPTRVSDALDLSALAVRAIRQNLFFAFLYNSIAIPLAVTGSLNPLIAVFAMFASSLTVIGNALRISKGKPAKTFFQKPHLAPQEIPHQIK